MAIELRRLARAVHLDAKALPTGAWLVSGGTVARLVQEDERGLRCNCPDAAFSHTCKHELAVRLRMGEPEVIGSLKRLVPLPGRAKATA